MSYNMRNDAYSCDYCGFEIKWDDSDDVHGEMWGCEECGATFCSKCFIDRFGPSSYVEMMQNFDLIMCPDCYYKKMNVEEN